MAQFQSAVKAMAPTSTIRKATGMEARPSNWVRARKMIRAMKAESMNTSPWAKLTIPMMPKTMV